MAITQSGFFERAVFSCIDLFCGCGGNSRGMVKESVVRPLMPLLALDADAVAVTTYRRNLPGVDVIHSDIREITPGEILDRANLLPGQLGCLVASPPCQTYSRNNRSHKSDDDHRNTLYLHTLKMVAGIRPWVVFMENVPEMQTYKDGVYHTDFIRRLGRLGYIVKFWTVNAADYGVPQLRYRLIYLAYRKRMQKIPHLPTPSHGHQPGTQPWVTVQDAIDDLPPRRAGDKIDGFIVDDGQWSQRSPYALSRGTAQCGMVANHSSRDLNPTQLSRLRALQEGQAYDDLPDDLKPRQGYKASYGRLWRSKPAPTLTAYLAYPGCGRFSHYEQDRTITIREALRLQAFDDDFVVTGNLSAQSSQVGNAVPPLLASAFRKVIVSDLAAHFGYADTLPSEPKESGMIAEVCPLR